MSDLGFWKLINSHFLIRFNNSTLAMNCYCQLRYFFNKDIGIINFAKHFLNFIDDTMI